MKSWATAPLAISAFWHSLFAVLIAVIGVFPSLKLTSKRIDFEVLQYPKLAPPSVQLQPQAIPKPAEPPKKSVFGVSRKAITAPDSATAAEVKQGNTVAKEQDNLKLDPNDPDSLPIPTDDYLVTSMPKLSREIRIPYPEQARKESIEGPVVMDLLIDETGKVRKVEVIKGPGSGLNEAAEQAAFQFQFLPASMGDKPVAVKIRYVYRFVLELK